MSTVAGAASSLGHSYTNDVFGDSAFVEKVYRGPQAVARSAYEMTILSALSGRIPVPHPVRCENGVLRMRFVEGDNAEELIKDGIHAPVLEACGALLRRLHSLDVAQLFGVSVTNSSQVLLHGDFGPHNLLFARQRLRIIAVLDWEAARLGYPIEDLAWFEWVIRTFHPQLVGELDVFFAAYGSKPDWPVRQGVMIGLYAAVVAHRRASSPENVEAHRERLQRLSATRGWTE